MTKKLPFLPAEIFGIILSFTDFDEKRRLKLVCKLFKKKIEELEPDHSILTQQIIKFKLSFHSFKQLPDYFTEDFKNNFANSKEKSTHDRIIHKIMLDALQKIHSIGDYRSYVDTLQVALLNKKISQENYDKLVATTTQKCCEIYRAKISRPTSIELVFNIILTFASLVTSFMMLGSTPNSHCLEAKSMQDFMQCQKKIDESLLYAFFIYVLFGAITGFGIKAFDKIIYLRMNNFNFNKNETSILPKLPLTKPLTRNNKSSYFYWRILQYRDFPFLITSFFIVYKLSKKILHIDLTDCFDKTKNSLDDKCYVEKMNPDTLYSDKLTIIFGALFSFSIIGIIVVLINHLTELFYKAKNKYVAYNNSRLFTPHETVSETSPLLPKEEQGRMRTRYTQGK